VKNGQLRVTTCNKKLSFKELNQQHEDDQVKLKLQLEVLVCH
jgi:hypothetical protein